MSKNHKKWKHEKRKLARDEIVKRDGSNCHWCSAELSPPGTSETGMTIDHVVRLADGGTSEIDNLVLSCNACNHRRGVQDEQRAKTRSVFADPEFRQNVKRKMGWA